MIAGPHVAILWSGLLVGAFTDLRAGRIPNLLTFPMMALGIVSHLVIGPDPWLGLVGCAAAFAIHYVGFAAGLEKAGDAKLMMGVGACVGWLEMVETTLWLAVLYLPVGLGALAIKGRLGNLAAALRWSANTALGRPAGERPEATWILAGPIIAASGAVANLTDWLDPVRFL